MSARNALRTATKLLGERSILISLALLLLMGAVWLGLALSAAQPKTLDQRAYAVETQLECPVCDGESVAVSPSGTAEQMRAIIRQKLAAGETERQVVADFERSYGETILESPPLGGFTLLMWIVPLLALAAGVTLVWSTARAWRAAPAGAVGGADGEDEDALADALEARLSASERARLAALLRRELAADEGLPVTLPGEGV